jgi:hypothetical protein
VRDGGSTNGDNSMRFDLWLADACRTADVSYDDFILTIAIGGYPCLPGTAPGSPRTFDETDLLALYVYGRLHAFGSIVLAGRRICRSRACRAESQHGRDIRR